MLRGVCMLVLAVQVSVAESYASTVPSIWEQSLQGSESHGVGSPAPPIAYRIPLATATASSARGVGIGALVIQVSVVGSYASRVARVSVVPVGSGFQPPTA